MSAPSTVTSTSPGDTEAATRDTPRPNPTQQRALWLVPRQEAAARRRADTPVAARTAAMPRPQGEADVGHEFSEKCPLRRGTPSAAAATAKRWPTPPPPLPPPLAAPATTAAAPDEPVDDDAPADAAAPVAAAAAPTRAAANADEAAALPGPRRSVTCDAAAGTRPRGVGRSLASGGDSAAVPLQP